VKCLTTYYKALDSRDGDFSSETTVLSVLFALCLGLIKLYPNQPTKPDDDALLWKKAVIVGAVYTVQDIVLSQSSGRGV
jgi:transketolase N-terminal domain/subunit